MSAFYPMPSITWRKKRRFNIFSARDEAMHQDMKKKIAKAYTSDALLSMEEAINECGDLILSHFGMSADQETPLHVGAWLHYYGMLHLPFHATHLLFCF